MTDEAYRPTRADLDEALTHFLYEVDQMIWASNLLKLQLNDPSPVMEALRLDAVRNALVESWLMHVRALDEFFTAPRIRRRTKDRDADTARASDFGFTARDGVLDESLRTRINKFAAHLTYARKRSDLQPWDSALHKPVIVAVLEFVDHLQREMPDLISPGAHVGRADAIANIRTECRDFVNVLRPNPKLMPRRPGEPRSED